MLKYLHIKNFAIIESLELEFHHGLSVLTGETGAGKSIIIDAIGLVLGDRADNNFIRADKDSAEITLIIEIDQTSAITEWLKTQELETDNECILRRVIRRDGKSRAYINSAPVPIKTLKELGEHAINIYGQNAHQNLMNQRTQRELVDQFANHNKELKQLSELYDRWRDTKNKYDHISAHSSDMQATIELLRYQVQELDQLDLQEGEIEKLEQNFKRLSNADSLKQSALQAYYELKNDESNDICNRLNTVCAEINNIAQDDINLKNIQQTLNEANITLDECANELRDYAEKVEINAEELAFTEERLGAIDQVARKHKINPGEIPELHTRLDNELQGLTQPEYDVDALYALLQTTKEEYKTLATKISQKRHKVAKKISREVTASLAKLGMEKAKLEVEVIELPEDNVTSYGIDKVEFRVQTNPGSKMLPLSQVASGGELSRISLAIQVIAADKLNMPVIIFDEVDAGVGGAVAEVVGLELQNIAHNRQVLCITHLAQVAAKAHHHYRVNKQSATQETASAIEYLDSSARITEIARMLGGVKLTENTFLHAREMLEGNIQ